MKDFIFCHAKFYILFTLFLLTGGWCLDIIWLTTWLADGRGAFCMATRMQIERMLEKLEHAHPDDFFKHVDETQAGIGAVLRLLYISNDTVTAGKISDELMVSTARVAVLLKKMVSKGLITKEHSPIDARITLVKLTEYGAKTIEEMRDGVYQQMGIVIDTVGEERLLEFITIAEEIKNAITPPKFNF